MLTAQVARSLAWSSLQPPGALYCSPWPLASVHSSWPEAALQRSAGGGQAPAVWGAATPAWLRLGWARAGATGGRWQSQSRTQSGRWAGEEVSWLGQRTSSPHCSLSLILLSWRGTSGLLHDDTDVASGCIADTREDSSRPGWRRNCCPGWVSLQILQRQP